MANKEVIVPECLGKIGDKFAVYCSSWCPFTKGCTLLALKEKNGATGEPNPRSGS